MRTTLLACILTLSVAPACNQSEFGEAPPDQNPNPNPNPNPDPGGAAWGSTNTACSSDVDCLQGETCLVGVCQMQRCTHGPYSSLAPVGPSFYFYKDKEFIVADGNTWNGSYWVDGYAPAY